MQTLLRNGTTDKEVEYLQEFLRDLNLYNGVIDGRFGPQTERAVKAFQQAQGLKADGIVGNDTRNAWYFYNDKNQSGTGNSNNNQTASTLDKTIQSLMQTDPDVARTIQSLQNSGNFESIYDYLLNTAGTPYDEKMVTEYMERNMKELDGYYREKERYDTDMIKNQMGLETRNFDRYLDNSAMNFALDKEKSDVSNANRGVLFSSSRENELKNLQDSYKADMEQKRDGYQTNLTNQLLAYQNDWGNASAKGVQNLAKLGSNSYDAFNMNNLVNKNGLQNIYNANNYDYTGRMQNEQVAEAKKRAGVQLSNYANSGTIFGSDKQY